jgi:hypothetical protein
MKRLPQGVWLGAVPVVQPCPKTLLRRTRQVFDPECLFLTLNLPDTLTLTTTAGELKFVGGIFYLWCGEAVPRNVCKLDDSPGFRYVDIRFEFFKSSDRLTGL